MNITLRPETSRDYRAVESLTRDAFWNLFVPGCDEHYLVHIMRDHPDFVKELAFVAEDNGTIIGNIMYMKTSVTEVDGNETLETLSFGPICVAPAYQHNGVGSQLICHTMALAVSLNYKAIIILGHPHNYCKHGFKSSKDFNICDAQGRYPFGQLAKELVPGVFNGKSWKYILKDIYNIDPSAVEQFDKQFPPKEKKHLISQEEFSIAVRAFL
jgi:predicted N-acetyltransferase YhbS